MAEDETNAEGTVTYTYDVTDQLTGARGESYSYDLNGNHLTAAPGATSTYDDEGNLTSKTDTATDHGEKSGVSSEWHSAKV